MTSPGKPLITANMVTSVRLLAMPLVAYLVYQHPHTSWGESGWWWALALGTVIGCTDFVDGLLARKYGPTVLGGMLDPLADKVFIALVYLPLMDLGFFPTWAVGLLFIREFLVTSIRSAYEWRGLQLKTSYFGKVKTWVQMQGIFVMVLVVLLTKQEHLIMLAVLTIAPAIAVGVIWLLKRRFHQSSGWAVLITGATILLFWLPEDRTTSVDIGVWAIAALTWMSGLDYLLGAVPSLRKAGGFHRADLIRVVAAIAVPISAVLAMTRTDAPPFPIIAIFAAELAVGGLDNLLSRHKASASFGSVAGRTMGASFLLLLCLVLEDQAHALPWLAMFVSLVGVAHEFWRGRAHYLDDSNWDEELVHDD